MTQKEYLGGVPATTLASGMLVGATTLAVASGDGANYPTAVSHPFVIVVDRGVANKEELMLVTSRSSDTFTVTRGYDGTSAVAHDANASVQHCIDAGVIDKASELVSKATTQGDIVYWSAAETPVRLAKGTARQQIAMNAGATAPEWVASLQSLLTAAGDILYASSANTPARLAKGTAGQVLKMNSGATAPEWASAKVPSARSKRTAGDITANSTSWADLVSGHDLTVAAAEGDVIEVSPAFLASNEAVEMYLDVATIVSAAVVNTASGGASLGIPGWWCPASVLAPVSGSVQFVAQAGDITGGTVVLRLRYKQASGTNRTVLASTTAPLFWSAKNLGQ